MSPKKMIRLSFAAPAAKGYEVFDKLSGVPPTSGGTPLFLRLLLSFGQPACTQHLPLSLTDAERL